MNETERDWTTEAGLRAVCVYVNKSHRCGYVALPETHPLHGKDYDANVPGVEVDSEWGAQIDCFFEVHGGVTFAGRLNEETRGLLYQTLHAICNPEWWIGFDCAHAGDATRYISFAGDVIRTEEYVVAECEKLACQLAAVKGA